MPFSTRLSLARDAGLSLGEGPIALFGATHTMDMPQIDNIVVVSRDARVHARLSHVVTAPPDRASATIVCLSREKARTRDDLAQAAAITNGPLVVDGQKTDGIEPVLKALKSACDVHGPISKSHGKLFWCANAPDLSAWRAAPLSVDGLSSWPGVFSAEKVDQGSALLAAALPQNLGRSACDLGAGWGWLSAHIAARTENLHMVETDGWALDCAERNVPHATAHWADVTTWQTPQLFDSVVMNPPFHEGRKGVPDLGQAFIQKAAEILSPTGSLYMVANRHLPYETTLGQLFARIDDMGGDGRFKLFHANRPRRNAVKYPRR